jgi:hypothetical protein
MKINENEPISTVDNKPEGQPFEAGEGEQIDWKAVKAAWDNDPLPRLEDMVRLREAMYADTPEGCADYQALMRTI